MTLDPITLEVVLNRIREVAGNMEHALYHSGYSSILRESQDGTAGLADAQGNVVMVSGGLQYHVIPCSQAIRCVIERYSMERLHDGDSFVVNDPYKAGNPHVPDMVAVTPVFYRERLVAFGVSIAHKVDLGGLVPGSSGSAAREIFHDGLRLPAVRYWTRDGVNEEIEAIIRTSSRVPDVVIGDLRGQVGCTRLAIDGIGRLADEYGIDTVLESMSRLLSGTAKQLADELEHWPDGAAEAEGFLDHDGADKSRPIRVHVRALKSGRKLALDFSGSDPQARGPVNVNPATVQAVSLIAVLAAVDPEIPMNSGLLRSVEFVLPEGRVVNPRFPATVNLYFPTAHLVYNCVLAALGKLNPVRAVAPSGLGSGAIAIGYARSRSGKAAVQYEILNTSLGGGGGHDGAAAVMAMNHYTPSTPVEILESEYPIRVRRFDIVPDSAGAGQWRGGIGIVRQYEMLEDCLVTVRGSNHRHAAWGLAGGASPLPARAALNPGTAREEELDILESRELKKGDVLQLQQSGGAGYGSPGARLRALVKEDVDNGYVSADAARRIYGL